MHSIRVCLFVLAALLLSSIVTARESCPAIVQQALQTVDDNCIQTGRNQACYGHVAVEGLLSDAALRFERAGDIVDVAAISSISLGPMDVESGHWGMALLRLQADIPDTLPGQNVTLLAFGDVTLTPDEDTVRYSTVGVLATANTNVRRGPSTDYAVVATLTAGQELEADAQNAAGTWLRLRLEGDAVGWVRADLVSVQGDSSALTVAEDNDGSSPSYAPMQSFYFRSGISDAGCAEAPDSGLLIQTPEGVGRVTLLSNGVEIRLGSTAYLQALPGGSMVLNIIEGQAGVSAEGRTVRVPAGTRTTVPLDAAGQASGPPTDIEPYTEDDIRALPLALLPRQIEAAVPLTAEEIAALNRPSLMARRMDTPISDYVHEELDICEVGSFTYEIGPSGTSPAVTSVIGMRYYATEGTTATFTVTTPLIPLEYLQDERMLLMFTPVRVVDGEEVLVSDESVAIVFWETTLSATYIAPEYGAFGVGFSVFTPGASLTIECG